MLTNTNQTFSTSGGSKHISMLGHQNDINEKLDEGIEAKLKIEEDKDAAAEKLSFAQQKEMAEIELHNDDLQFQE